MSLSFAFFTFLNAWFVALFLAFPFSIQMGHSDEKLDYQAAPRVIHWKKLFLIASTIAISFTILLVIIMKSGMVQL